MIILLEAKGFGAGLCFVLTEASLHDRAVGYWGRAEDRYQLTAY
jgi:hypothetical protein